MDISEATAAFESEYPAGELPAPDQAFKAISVLCSGTEPTAAQRAEMVEEWLRRARAYAVKRGGGAVYWKQRPRFETVSTELVPGISRENYVVLASRMLVATP